MANSLWDLANNLSEGIHRIKCKYGHDNKNVKLVELSISIATVFFEYSNLKDDLIQYKCLSCKKVINKSLMES